MNHYQKNTKRFSVFAQRGIAAMQPFIHEDIHGRFRHSFTWRMPQYFILISTSGFPEAENFDALELTVKAQAYNFGSEFTASFCVPGSLGLQMEISLLDPHLDLLCQAGAEFGSQRTVSPSLLDRINAPILSPKEFYKHYLKYEEWCKNRLLKK